MVYWYIEKETKDVKSIVRRASYRDGGPKSYYGNKKDSYR